MTTQITPMNNNNNNNKRMRETQPTAEDVILIGRDIQNKSGLGNGSARENVPSASVLAQLQSSY